MKKQKKTNRKIIVKENAGSLSRRKTWIFTIIMISCPLVFLVLIELSLRMGHYQSNVDSLVTIKKYQGKEYYTVNQEYGANYFASHNIGTPQPHEEIFEVNKSPQTYRIFCLGESTMYGYPFPSNISAPRFLKKWLSVQFPEINFEVVNLAIPAISSSVVLDLLKQVLKYEPDLIIVYSGHDEFYGTYGVASTEYVAYNKKLVDIYLQLRKLKLVALLRDGVLKTEVFLMGQKEQTRKTTFLEGMVDDRYIVYGSAKYERAKDVFRSNLYEMVECAAQHNVPICLSTLVSNLKDQYPFISLFSPSITEDQRLKWEEYYMKGSEFEKSGDDIQALQMFENAIKIDSMRADLWYHIGKCYLKRNEIERAQTTFMKARDLDVLRFRATSEFNDIIRSIGAEKHALIADIERSFVSKSQNGLLGNELFTEHLHPNVAGYALMGKVYCQAMAEHNLVKPFGHWAWENEPSDDEFLKTAPFSNVDIESGNIRVMILTSSWPFRQKSLDSYFTPKTQLEEVALSYCKKEISWDEAHYKMARYYQQRKEFDLAKKEYEVVAKELYLFYHPLMQMGDMDVLLGHFTQAEREYKDAIELNSNQFILLRLGNLYLQERKTDDAILYLTKAIDIDNNALVMLSPEARVMSELSLGGAYFAKGEYSLALNAFLQVSSLDPGNKIALVMIKKLETIH